MDFELFNPKTESILFVNEHIRFLLEFGKNKLFVTVWNTCMFLIYDWVNVKCIIDPDRSNTYKSNAFLVPDFDLEKFPFIAVCGKSNLSLLNVRDCSL